MRRIRPFVAADIPRVADLYHRTFLENHPTLHRFTAQQVADDFAEIFFRHPWSGARLDSLVCESADGALQGFLGMTPRPMTFQGRPVLAAVSVHHMVEPTPQARLAGMQMLKAFFEGPQDFSFTDGANDLGKKVCEGFGARTAWLPCFEWRRVLQPSSYVLTGIGNRFKRVRPVAQAIKPLGRGADRVLRGVMPGGFAPTPSESTEAVLDVPTMLSAFDRAAANVSLKPEYTERSLGWLLGRAAKIRTPGELQRVAVQRGGRVIGWFLYYLNAGAFSEVIQIGAERGAAGEVVDQLFAHAARNGAVAVYGRVEPHVMDALSAAERQCSFRVAHAKVLFHSRNDELLKAVYEGDAFLTKLEGEWCTSFRM